MYVDDTIDSKIDTALTTDIVGGTGITITDDSPGSGQITVAVTAGSIGATQLASTTVTAGDYGSSTEIPAITVDADGRITAASTNSITQVGGSNGVDFNDSVQARFGTGNDLTIDHNGTNSIIDNNTGDLYIQTTGSGDDVIIEAVDDIFLKPRTGENGIQVLGDGAVKLAYDSDFKLETKADGVDIAGELQCDVLDVDGNADIAGRMSVNGILVRDNGTSSPVLSVRTDDGSPWAFVVGNDTYSSSDTGLRVYQHDNGNLYTQVRGNNEYVNWYFTSSNGTTAPTMVHFDTNRAVHLNYQGNTKLSTESNGVDITGTLECDTLAVGSSLQQGNVASFKGSSENQVNIADSTNSSWGLLLTQSQGVTNTSSYHYSTNSGENKPCAIVNVNGDALHFGTNNTARFRVEHDGHVVPSSNNSYDLGSSSYRWRNLYTNDLNLSNEGSTNDVDGTWGDYTIQEGKDDLFLINKRNGKKYKFMLKEVE